MFKGTMVFSQIERYKVVSKKTQNKNIVKPAYTATDMISRAQHTKPCGKCGNSK